MPSVAELRAVTVYNIEPFKTSKCSFRSKDLRSKLGEFDFSFIPKWKGICLYCCDINLCTHRNGFQVFGEFKGT